MHRFIRWVLVGLAAPALGLPVAPVAATTTEDASTATRYVFTAFTNASESNMNVYTSPDARTFTLLKADAYTPPSGLVRDPSVLQAADGRYYIVYTDGWTGSTFGVASSLDLINWSYLTTVDVGVAGTRETWAPEWFVDPADGSVNVIVSLSASPLSADDNFHPFRLRAQNAELTQWSPAAALSGDWPNYIDTFLVWAGGTYHAFAKNETTKYVEHATASSLGGPYTWVGTGDWAGWGPGEEGPSVTRLDDGTWRMFLDNYTGGRYYSSDSPDLSSWSGLAEVPGGLSGVVRHGTVLRDPVPTTVARPLRGKGSGRCLTAPSRNGAQLSIRDCDGGPAQRWSYTAAGQLTVDARCLDGFGQGTGNGTVVDAWPCNGQPNQEWTRNADGSFTGVQSGRCVDVTGATTDNGAPVELWDCNGGTNQEWTWMGS